MAHEFLLHANRRAADIEHRAIAVPEGMPAQTLDTNLLARWDKNLSLQNRRVPDHAGVGIRENPALLARWTQRLPSQENLRDGRIERHFVLAVLRLHPSDPSHAQFPA